MKNNMDVLEELVVKLETEVGSIDKDSVESIKMMKERLQGVKALIKVSLEDEMNREHIGLLDQLCLRVSALESTID